MFYQIDNVGKRLQFLLKFALYILNSMKLSLCLSFCLSFCLSLKCREALRTKGLTLSFCLSKWVTVCLSLFLPEKILKNENFSREKCAIMTLSEDVKCSSSTTYCIMKAVSCWLGTVFPLFIVLSPALGAGLQYAPAILPFGVTTAHENLTLAVEV